MAAAPHHLGWASAKPRCFLAETRERQRAGLDGDWGGWGGQLQRRLSFRDLAVGRSKLLFIGTPVPRFVLLGLFSKESRLKSAGRRARQRRRFWLRWPRFNTCSSWSRPHQGGRPPSHTLPGPRSPRLLGRTPAKINKSLCFSFRHYNYSKHALAVNSDREAIVEGAQTRLAFGPGEQQEEPQLQLAPLAEHKRLSEVGSGVLARHPRHVAHQLFP